MSNNLSTFDTLATCHMSFTRTRAYIRGEGKPHYPVPARLIDFDYWPATSTDSGLPAFYGHDHYKPGRWLEFLTIE